MRLTLGHPGALLVCQPLQAQRLPDAVDHLAFLYGVVKRISRLKTCLGLDLVEVGSRQKDASGKGGRPTLFLEWVVTARARLSRGILLEVKHFVLCYSVKVNHLSNAG